MVNLLFFCLSAISLCSLTRNHFAQASPSTLKELFERQSSKNSFAETSNHGTAPIDADPYRKYHDPRHDRLAWIHEVHHPVYQLEFPKVIYDANEKAIADRDINRMSDGDKLVLCSRLLHDMKDIPYIDEELRRWQKDLTREEVKFWDPLKVTGVVPWTMPPTQESLNQLPSIIASISGKFPRGADRFIEGYRDGKACSYMPEQHDPVFKCLQRMFDDTMKEAKVINKRSTHLTCELRAKLKEAWNILHVFQLSYRNLAAQYMQLSTQFNNEGAGRPRDYLPNSNYGDTKLHRITPSSDFDYFQ